MKKASQSLVPVIVDKNDNIVAIPVCESCGGIKVLGASGGTSKTSAKGINAQFRDGYDNIRFNSKPSKN